MVQRKGNLSVADSRSSEERGQEDLGIMAAATMVKGPTAPPVLGELPRYSTEGAGRGEPGLISVPNPSENQIRWRTSPYQGRAITFAKTTSGSRAREPAQWVLLGTYSVFYIGSVKLERLKSFL